MAFTVDVSYNMNILQLGASFHQSLFILSCSKSDSLNSIITLDNRPNNYGHSFSSRSIDHSITDSRAVYFHAQSAKAHLSAYGSDIAMLTLTEITICPLTRSLRALCIKSEARPLLQKIWPKYQPRIITHEMGLLDLEYLRSDKIVVKPNISSGSKGVSICQKDSLTQNILNMASAHSLDGKLVVEEYIPNDGNKYFCEGIMCNSRLYIAVGKSTSLDNSLIWDGSILFTKSNCYSFCGLKYARLIEKLSDSINELLRHLGLDSFAYLPFNIDFFVKGKDIFIIEFAPRPGGNFLHLYLEYLYDIDYAETFIQALGNNVDLPINGSPYLKPGNTPLCIQISTNPKTTEIPEAIFQYPSADMPASTSHLTVSYGTNI